MKLRKRTRLALEQLEDRFCPAQTISLASGSLTFTGSPVGNLKITETAQGVLNVSETATPASAVFVNLGSHQVTNNLTLNLTSEPGTVTVDLGTFFLPGSININLGTGNPNLQPVTVKNGTVNGSVFIQGGSGQENINLGLTPVVGPNQALTVKGNVTVNGIVSSGSFFPAGDTLLVNPGSTILGSLSTSQIDNVNIGELGAALTTVDGQVVINDQGSGAALFVNIFGTVNNNVTVIGTNLEDDFTLEPASTGVGGIINGSLNASLAGGNVFGNVITLAAGSNVTGTANLSSGSNISPTVPNLFTIEGTIGLDLTLSMGNGTNEVQFAGSVGRNMSVTAGTGVNDLGGAGVNGFGGFFNGQIQGNLTLNLQGTNYFYFDGSNNGGIIVGGNPEAASVGGKISYISGNGDNTFEVSTGGRIVTLNVTFGTGNDTFTIDAAADEAELTGFLDWGDQVFGNDIFNEPVGGAFVLPWAFLEVQ